MRKILTLFSFLFFLCFLLGSCGNYWQSLFGSIPLAGQASLSGRVLEKETKLPIEGAVVRCGGSATTSQADGSYRFSHLPLGYHSLSVQHKLYRSISFSQFPIKEGANQHYFHLELAVPLITEDITTPTVWEEEEYVIAGKIKVTAELVISPGTKVYFRKKAALSVVQGKLIARSFSPSRPIVFTSFSSSPSQPNWRGISLFSAEGIFENCQVELAYIGLEIIKSEEKRIEIKNSVFQNNDLGMRIERSSAIIENTLICRNHGDGLRISGAGENTAQLWYCQLKNNGEIGISCLGSSVVICQTQVSHNQRNGIFCSPARRGMENQIQILDTQIIGHPHYAIDGHPKGPFWQNFDYITVERCFIKDNCSDLRVSQDPNFKNPATSGSESSQTQCRTGIEVRVE
jgi:hypothetical protein